MKRQKILSLIATLGLSLVFVAGVGFGLFSPLQRADAAPPAGFVYRCGIHFCLNGELFYFAGANTYDVFTYGDGSSTATQSDIENKFMDKARIDAHFARLQADKVTALRLWMFSHESWHGFEPSKGVYSEAQFMLFDYIIVSAQLHNVRLIPAFENYWEAYGGIDTRLSWEGLTGGHPGRAKFFNKSVCPGCFTQYKNYVSYVLNRTNHYTGVKYKDEPAILAWELMNEPRYQDVSAEENTSGATLRAWVDEMGAYIKGIDPNHMLGTGLEGHESRYGFGGNEGNPFIAIHQSPYIDFTSAHPYVDESWANLTMDQSRALVWAWISDSHNVVGKPFFMGEFNTFTGDRLAWWTMFYQELEAGDAGGSAFWWYQDHAVDSKFGVSQGAPELVIFRAHSAVMQAKSPQGGPTPTPWPTPDPTKVLKVQYLARNTLPGDNEISPSVMIVNTGVGLQTVPLAELKFRYWYTSDSTQPQQFSCLYAELGCSTMTGVIVKLATPREGADSYLEVSLSGTGSLSPYASSGVIQNRINRTDWSSFDESNDWSFDGTKTAFVDWNHITLYRNGTLVWGIEPGGTPPPTTPPPTTPPPTTPPPTTPPPTTPPPTTPPPTTPPPSGNTGWVSPAAQAAQSGGDGNGFQTSPTSAFADDSAYATDTDSGNGTSTSCTSTNKDRHAYYSYPISIPAGATINGIEVRLDSRADSTSGTPRHCVDLSWNNGSSWTTARQTGTLTTSMATRTLGSASDTWGRTWTTGELSSATLRVRITNVASSTSRDFFLDWVAVRVTYGGATPPPTTPPPTTPPPTTPPPTTPPPTTPPPTTPPPTTPPPTTPPPTTPPPTTPPPGGACNPVTSTIAAPFTYDGPGTFCWQTSNLGSYINSWNLVSLTVNGVDFTNRYVSVSSLPAKINGFWYVSYRGDFAWSHFEAK